MPTLKHMRSFFYAMCDLLQSTSQALFVTAVLEGLKPAQKLVVPEELVDAFQRACHAAGLETTSAHYKYLISRTQADKPGYFITMDRRVPISSRKKGACIVYASFDSDSLRLIRDVDESRQAESDAYSRRLGELLGYPPCCTSFWSRYALRYECDPIIPSIRSFRDYPFYNNVCQRYHDIALVDHIPCSGECAATVTRGAAHYRLLRRLNMSYAKAFKRYLRSLILFTQHEGVFFTNDYSKRGRTIRYRTYGGTSVTSRVDRLLRENDTMTIRSCKSVVIGDHKLDGEYVIMRYV